jgi:hypothetical protein
VEDIAGHEGEMSGWASWDGWIKDSTEGKAPARYRRRDWLFLCDAEGVILPGLAGLDGDGGLPHGVLGLTGFGGTGGLSRGGVLDIGAGGANGAPYRAQNC